MAQKMNYTINATQNLDRIIITVKPKAPTPKADETVTINFKDLAKAMREYGYKHKKKDFFDGTQWYDALLACVENKYCLESKLLKQFEKK